jgi:hypothetical protein
MPEGVGNGVFNLSRLALIFNFLVCRSLFRHGLVRMPSACPGGSLRSPLRAGLARNVNLTPDQPGASRNRPREVAGCVAMNVNLTPDNALEFTIHRVGGVRVLGEHAR